MASNLNIPALPLVLKPIAHLLKTASEHETRDPVITYWARLAALQSGLNIDKKSKEATAVLIPLMDWLEKEKKVLAGNEAITSEIVASAHVENYAMKLFGWADAEDRAERFNKNVVKAFYTSGNLFDVLKVFGELTPENTHVRKYAKWKAAYIHNCLKNGEKPIPGPANSGEDDDEEGTVQDPHSAGGWSQPPQAPTMPERPPEPVIPPYPSEPCPPKNPRGAGSLAPQAQPSSSTSSAKAIAPEAQPSSSTASAKAIAPADALKVQKLCKFASSALDYDDVDTAIKNLTEALQILHSRHA